MTEPTRTKAHQMIEDHHVKRGATLYLQVFGSTDQGLPEDVISPHFGVPTRIDLLGGRPTNVAFTDNGFEVDLCFHASPPSRCSFMWKDVIAISTGPKEGWVVLVHAATAVLLEDNRMSIHVEIPKAIQAKKKAEEDEGEPTKKERLPFLKVVK